jgi:uncharacterized membrane protein
MFRWGVGLGLAAAILASAVSAQDFKPNQIIRDRVAIGGKQIPLPSGDWRVAGAAYSAIRYSSFSNLGAFGSVENIVAFRQAGNTIDSFVEINTNSLPIIDGWGLSKECLRTDLYLTVTRYRTGFDGACFFIKRTTTGATNGSLKAWATAKGYAQSNKLDLPAAWITVGFRFADRQDIVDVRFHFNPATRGLPAATPSSDPANDPWGAEKVKADVAKLRFIEELSFWGTYVNTYFQKGLRNQLASTDAMPMPSAALLSQQRPDVQDRLKALEKFRAENSLTQTQFEAQRDMILNEPTALASDGWLSSSMKKNLSFRVFGSIVDWLLAFGVTLSAPVSTGITASIVAIHSVVFVFNDHYWDNYWIEKGRREGSQTVDFHYIGDQPAPNMVVSHARS